MIESFVDLSYRGLALGRRIKLTQVRPTTGYLELPMPMPVGTQIAMSTDDGITLEATVTQIYEQVGGSERVPGMTVKPKLDKEALAWWKERVALPEDNADERPRERTRSITVRPRSHTVPAPPHTVPAAPPPPVVIPPDAQPLSSEVTATKELSVYVAEQPAPKLEEEDVKRTMVMNAVDQDLLARLTKADGEVERLVRRTGEHDVVDDGQRTTVMDAVDPASLGFDVTASGSFRAQTDSGETDDDDDDEQPPDDKPPSKSSPSIPKQGKKRKKRR